MKPASTTSTARSGFTLFEVMAAVLILGIIYTVLADAAMDGLRSEGTNRRRGEASLLADHRLAEIEAQLATGTAPTPGRNEEQVPPSYLVTTEVKPIDVMQLLPPDPDADAGAKTGTRGPEPEVKSLLEMKDSGESRVQQVTVTVEWEEVGQPYRVVRTTFAFDKTGLEDLFPSEEGLGDALGGGAGGGTGESGGEGGGVPQNIQDLINRIPGGVP